MAAAVAMCKQGCSILVCTSTVMPLHAEVQCSGMCGVAPLFEACTKNVASRYLDEQLLYTQNEIFVTAHDIQAGFVRYHRHGVPTSYV